MNLPIDEWIRIRVNFEKMFDGLGEVETSEEILQFTSIEPYVATGISLTRQGKMAASMPLHHVDSTFHQVAFDDSLKELTLIGEGFEYTYRIPSELFSQRLNQTQ